MPADDVKINIGVDTSRLDAGLKSVEQKVNSTTSKIDKNAKIKPTVTGSEIENNLRKLEQLYSASVSKIQRIIKSGNISLVDSAQVEKELRKVESSVKNSMSRINRSANINVGGVVGGGLAGSLGSTVTVSNAAVMAAGGYVGSRATQFGNVGGRSVGPSKNAVTTHVAAAAAAGAGIWRTGLSGLAKSGLVQGAAPMAILSGAASVGNILVGAPDIPSIEEATKYRLDRATKNNKLTGIARRVENSAGSIPGMSSMLKFSNYLTLKYGSFLGIGGSDTTDLIQLQEQADENLRQQDLNQKAEAQNKVRRDAEKKRTVPGRLAILRAGLAVNGIGYNIRSGLSGLYRSIVPGIQSAISGAPSAAKTFFKSANQAGYELSDLRSHTSILGLQSGSEAAMNAYEMSNLGPDKNTDWNALATARGKHFEAQRAEVGLWKTQQARSYDGDRALLDVLNQQYNIKMAQISAEERLTAEKDKQLRIEREMLDSINNRKSAGSGFIGQWSGGIGSPSFRGN